MQAHHTLQWDSLGNQLAAVPDGGCSASIWLFSTKNLQKVEADFKVWTHMSTCDLLKWAWEYAEKEISQDKLFQRLYSDLQTGLYPEVCIWLVCILGQAQEITFLAWSVSGSILCWGTNKGSILIFYSQEKRRLPIVGKHSRMISCGAWNVDNQIVLGSMDKTVSEGIRD